MRNDIGKIVATRLIHEYGLEGLPTRVVEDRGKLQQTLAELGADKTFVIRAASTKEERNLPRAIGLASTDVVAWADHVPLEYALIVQPFAPLIFSVELLISNEGMACELVPGMWELDNQFSPTLLRLEQSPSASQFVSLEWHSEPVGAHWHARGALVAELCRVDDWARAVLHDWVDLSRIRLQRLREYLGTPYGLKVHYAEGHGISPQNIRSRLPADTRSVFQPITLLHPPVIVAATTDVIPDGATEVLIRLGVAREAASAIEEFAQRLMSAGVSVVYLESGMLSHLAIALREAGLVTRRRTPGQV